MKDEFDKIYCISESNGYYTLIFGIKLGNIFPAAELLHVRHMLTFGLKLFLMISITTS
jgi:hypothetical protein